MNDTVPTQICEPHHTTGENRQGLSQLLDTRICDIRPVSIGQFTRVSFIGGSALKIRRPEPGEIGLSDAEIDHAMTYGISA